MNQTQRICSMVTSLTQSYALRLLSMKICQKYCVLWTSNNS